MKSSTSEPGLSKTVTNNFTAISQPPTSSSRPITAARRCLYSFFLWLLFCMDFTNLVIIYSTDSFPGLWEVPMIDYIDLKGEPCSMIDGCSAPANYQETYELLSRNFDRHYNSESRAPFPMFMHASWFTKHPYTLSGKSMKYTLV